MAVPVVKSGEKHLLVPHFGRAPSFAVAEVEESGYRVVEVFENPHTLHEHGRGAAVVGELGSHAGDRLRSLLQAQEPRGKSLLRNTPGRQEDRNPGGSA